MDISAVDSNLAVETNLSADDIVFLDSADERYFSLHGLLRPTESENYYRRIPGDVAKNTNEGVFNLHRHSAGGRVKFRTNSPYIAIKAYQSAVCHFSHMPMTGTAGYDIYAKKDGEEKELYMRTFVPPFDSDSRFEGYIDFPDGDTRCITLNFPLYTNTDVLYIGLKEGSFCEPNNDYKVKTPVVYYGSSITQGGCASRPGSAYQAIISQKLSCDHINLGFSGSAKGEKAIADHIASLDMSVFVMDYDHNAPSAEHLEKTHEPFFGIIREKHPLLPVIFVSRPHMHLDEDGKKRLEIIRKTFDNAVAAGDKNVYFVDGSKFFEEFYGENSLVDNCHPNDLGFMYMAKGIGDAVEKALRNLNL